MSQEVKQKRRSPRLQELDQKRKGARVMRTEPLQELKDEPRAKRRRIEKAPEPAAAPEVQAPQLSERQMTLSATSRLPQIEAGSDKRFFYWDSKCENLTGKSGRSALVLVDLVTPFLQVKDMAQMVRVNKRWRAICDKEIPVSPLFLCVKP